MLDFDTHTPKSRYAVSPNFHFLLLHNIYRVNQNVSKYVLPCAYVIVFFMWQQLY